MKMYSKSVRFIRKNGRIIPIGLKKKAQDSGKISRMIERINELNETKNKVKSHFIKKNASDRMREIIIQLRGVIA